MYLNMIKKVTFQCIYEGTLTKIDEQLASLMLRYQPRPHKAGFVNIDGVCACVTGVSPLSLGCDITSFWTELDCPKCLKAEHIFL